MIKGFVLRFMRNSWQKMFACKVWDAILQGCRTICDSLKSLKELQQTHKRIICFSPLLLKVYFVKKAL